LIDTGVNSPDSLAAFQAALRTVGCAPERIRKIICTHHHPDHFGSSKPYRELTGAAVYLSRREYESSTHYGPQQRSDLAIEFFRANGIPLGRLARVPSQGEFWASLYVPTIPDHFIADGDVIRVGDLEIEVIATPGHTAEHCVMYLRRQRIMI